MGHPVHRHIAIPDTSTQIDADCRALPGKQALLPKMWWHNEDFMQVFSALLYAFSAVAMSMINRFCLKIFPLPTILLLLQMSATLVILYPLLVTGRLTFVMWSWQRFRQLLGISILYTANTAFALFGLKTLNLPMYTAIKRLTPMLVLVLKALWKKRWPQPRITMSVSLVVLGCLIAGVGDLSFDFWAYMFAFSSVIMQSMYLLLVEFQGDGVGASTSELLWYNAITSLPLLTAVTAATGDFQHVAAAWIKGQSAHGSLYFYFMITSAATMGCLLNFSMFLCTMYTTALTTTIVGVLRGVVTILLGFAFDTGNYSLVNVTGIAINTCGGLWYTWIKYAEKYGASGCGTTLPAAKTITATHHHNGHGSGGSVTPGGVSSGRMPISSDYKPLMQGPPQKVPGLSAADQYNSWSGTADYKSSSMGALYARLSTQEEGHATPAAADGTDRDAAVALRHGRPQ